jgi:NADH-quinone oxidoreductase subunit L
MLSEVTSSFLRFIPALPLLTGVLHLVSIGLLRRRLSARAVAMISSAAHTGALLLSILAFWELIALDDNAALVDRVGTWIGVGVAPSVFTADLAFRFDALSAIFCLVVAGVGLLVQVFAAGYMEADQRDDRGFQRYFGYSDLFLASMLIVVLADNLVLLFLGWVGVGIFSYLLIGFWYAEQVSARAATSAFVVGRVGDLALVIGIVLVFWTLAAAGSATLRLGEIEAALQAFDGVSFALPVWLGGHPIAVAAIAGFCFLIAACAQAAQLPFLLWLPGSTAAPSPASALVHGACMGAAGVYLLARLSFLFAIAPEAAALMAWIGVVTALLSAGLACVETDIKRVLAYSTATHQGFMFLGVGAGDPTAAVHHAVSHAFFQPVLFMGAGVVIASLRQEHNLLRMGNVGSRIHLTRICMWIALLSSIGVPPFWSGYFSREQILVAAHDALLIPLHAPLYVLALVAVGLLAFSVVRLMYLALYGETRFPGEIRMAIEEPEPIMLRPMAILATLCVLGCTIGLPQAWADLFPFSVKDSDSIRRFLAGVLTTSAVEQSPSSWSVSGQVVGMTVLGALPAALLYVFRPELPQKLETRFAWLHGLVANRFYLDVLFERGIVQPMLTLSDRVLGRWLDQRLIDGVVVDGTARLLQRLSDRVLKHAEPGTIQLYLALMLVGGLAMVIWLLRAGGAA